MHACWQQTHPHHTCSDHSGRQARSRSDAKADRRTPPEVKLRSIGLLVCCMFAVILAPLMVAAAWATNWTRSLTYWIVWVWNKRAGWSGCLPRVVAEHPVVCSVEALANVMPCTSFFVKETSTVHDGAFLRGVWDRCGHNRAVGPSPPLVGAVSHKNARVVSLAVRRLWLKRVLAVKQVPNPRPRHKVKANIHCSKARSIHTKQAHGHIKSSQRLPLKAQMHAHTHAHTHTHTHTRAHTRTHTQ